MVSTAVLYAAPAVEGGNMRGGIPDTQGQNGLTCRRVLVAHRVGGNAVLIDPVTHMEPGIQVVPA